MEKVQPSFHYSCWAEMPSRCFQPLPARSSAGACFLPFLAHHSSSLAVSLLQKRQCGRLVCRQWPVSRPYRNVVLRCLRMVHCVPAVTWQPSIWKRGVAVFENGALCIGSDLTAVHTETSCWMFETSVLFVLRQTTHIKHLFSVFSWKVCYKHLWPLDLVKLVPPATHGSCPHTAVETPSQNPWQPPHPTAMAVLHFGLLKSSNVLCLNVFFLQFVLHTTFLLKLAKMKLCVVLCCYCISLEGKHDLLW